MIPVILSGGSGSRMWPYSRSMYPKQFLPLVNDESMLQNTVQRLSGFEALDSPIVICNESHRFMVAEQLREIDIAPEAILLEPVGRNTAPAIALAALHAIREGEDAELLVLPSDHVIEKVSVFHDAIEVALKQAKAGRLVTFGIQPEYAEVGYGYIKSIGNGLSRQVVEFLEKPDLELAEQYVASGQHYWNSGMFLFKASAFIEALIQYRSDIYSQVKKAYEGAVVDLDFVRVDNDAFERCPSDSVDYAIMEPAAESESVVVVPLDADWNDVGSWSSLWSISKKDVNGNATKGDVITHETTNSYIQAQGKLVATVGVSDLVVVQTDDAVLVADKNSVQSVKNIVLELSASSRSEAQNHRKVYRPWGYFDSLDKGDGFQVKRLVVNPGSKLSVQKHHHRAEHWVVVSGTAKVRNGDNTFLLTENESTYIPIGEIHSLENPGTVPLEIIEVQSGGYLGEDDIVRLEDNYGRV